MISEYVTDELAIYVVEPRKVVDDYTQAKANKDRKKLLIWLTTLMKHHDVVLFYMDDDGLEKHIIATLRDIDPEGIVMPPLVEETTKKGTVLTQHHCAFMSQPGREYKYLHLDHITKFIVKNEKLSELSKVFLSLT